MCESCHIFPHDLLSHVTHSHMICLVSQQMLHIIQQITHHSTNVTHLFVEWLSRSWGNMWHDFNILTWSAWSHNKCYTSFNIQERSYICKSRRHTNVWVMSHECVSRVTHFHMICLIIHVIYHPRKILNLRVTLSHECVSESRCHTNVWASHVVMRMCERVTHSDLIYISCLFPMICFVSYHMLHMGWLWLVGSFNLYISSAEYRLFYRAVL